MIQFHVMLAVLCVAVAASGYLGWLSGIHSKRNASYERGYNRAVYDYVINDITGMIRQRKRNNVR